MAEAVRINLALQGGGAHGAFTWGVLDRLLADERVEIAAISGTSAGALNGAALKVGMVRGGREGARENLDWLWGRIGSLDHAAVPEWMEPFLPPVGLMSKAIEYSPGWLATDAWSRAVSPYASGPFGVNPLARIVDEIDYGTVCGEAGPPLFVSATNVRSGQLKVFSGSDIGPETILASACLPTLFRAVEVVDPDTGVAEAFWDGGYTGNPALHPLYDPALPRDIVIVNINPIYRDSVPVTAQEIQNRVNEISFNAALLKDLRAVRFVKRLIAEGAVAEGSMKDVLVHMIADDPLMNELSVATKLVPVPVVIQRLKAAGTRAADRFLALHCDDLGQRDSTDLGALFV